MCVFAVLGLDLAGCFSTATDFGRWEDWTSRRTETLASAVVWF